MLGHGFGMTSWSKRGPGLSYLLATRLLGGKASCRHSHSNDHISLTLQWGQRHLLSPSARRVGPWIHTENMKAVTSGGLGPRPKLIFISLWQSSPSLEPTWKLSEQIHRGLVMIGRTHPGLSQLRPIDQYKATGALMPNYLEMKTQIVFSLQFARKGFTSKNAQWLVSS